jgi:hypothetical protein
MSAGLMHAPPGAQAGRTTLQTLHVNAHHTRHAHATPALPPETHVPSSVFNPRGWPTLPLPCPLGKRKLRRMTSRLSNA